MCGRYQQPMRAGQMHYINHRSEGGNNSQVSAFLVLSVFAVQG